MYPKNAASPPVIAVGQVILIADGSVVTADASARVKIGTGDWGASAGTLACDSTSGCWTYTPSQAETNAESFIVAVYKASCIGCQVTVVTTASATAGKAYVSNIDNDAITAASIAAGAIDAATFAADVDAEARSWLGLATNNLDTQIAAVKSDTAAVLVDTGTTLDTLIKDIPTVAEFEARTLAAASYFDPSTDTVTADVISVDGTPVAGPDDLKADVSALATAAELAKVPKSDGSASWNATALAAINAQCDTAISDAALATAASLSTVSGYVDTEVAAIKAVTDKLDTIIEVIP